MAIINITLRIEVPNGADENAIDGMVMDIQSAAIETRFYKKNPETLIHRTDWVYESE
jgi:hypothetical protein